jgi:DNA-binding HxlR family transcriptional regulator
MMIVTSYVTCMRRNSFEKEACPIARGLERVGEWWSMLIMRDALHGIRRFDEFQKSLGIAPNMLARRLNSLVEAGLLERRRYSEHPPRDEYLPTARGRDFRPVLLSLLAWGNRHFAPEGASVLLVDRRSGRAVDPILADPATGRPVDEPDYTLAPGPAAGPLTLQTYGTIPKALSPAEGQTTANRNHGVNRGGSKRTPASHERGSENERLSVGPRHKSQCRDPAQREATGRAQSRRFVRHQPRSEE